MGVGIEAAGDATTYGSVGKSAHQDFFLLSAVDLEMLVFVLVLARVVDRKSRNFKQLCANIHYLGRNGMDEIRMVGFPA